MAKFLIVLALCVACGYFIIAKSNMTFHQKYNNYGPTQHQKIFDFEGAKQKGLERQRRIDAGEFF